MNLEKKEIYLNLKVSNKCRVPIPCMCNFRRFHNKTFLRFDMFHLHNAVIDSELKNVDLHFWTDLYSTIIYFCYRALSLYAISIQ